MHKLIEHLIRWLTVKPTVSPVGSLTGYLNVLTGFYPQFDFHTQLPLLLRANGFPAKLLFSAGSTFQF